MRSPAPDKLLLITPTEQLPDHQRNHSPRPTTATAELSGIAIITLHSPARRTGRKPEGSRNSESGFEGRARCGGAGTRVASAPATPSLRCARRRSCRNGRWQPAVRPADHFLVRGSSGPETPSGPVGPGGRPCKVANHEKRSALEAPQGSGKIPQHAATLKPVAGRQPGRPPPALIIAFPFRTDRRCGPPALSGPRRERAALSIQPAFRRPRHRRGRAGNRPSAESKPAEWKASHSESGKSEYGIQNVGAPRPHTPRQRRAGPIHRKELCSKQPPTKTAEAERPIQTTSPPIPFRPHERPSRAAGPGRQHRSRQAVRAEAAEQKPLRCLTAGQPREEKPFN